MRISYHVHSKYSDGSANIGDIVSCAEKLGLDEVGISDHFLLSPNGEMYYWAMKRDNLDRYISEITSFSNNRIPLRLGLEADYYEETVGELDKIVRARPFDYIIGSVHIVERFVIDSSKESLPQNFCDTIVKEYWRLVRKMAESGVFDIVAHLDLTKKFNICSKREISSEIIEALEAIKKRDMTVELNTAGWYCPCAEQYPSLELLRICKELDIPIVVTSDAHRPENLCRDFDKAYGLLRDIGFSHQASFKGRKRFMHALPKL